MLNDKGERELAYISVIDNIEPIPNYDRVELATVKGWKVIVRKDQFKVGDLAVYIEIDSKVPETEPFAFLEKRKYAVKTLKMCKVLSQGLLMSPSDFGWKTGWEGDSIEGKPFIYNGDKIYYEGDFVTKDLGITYYVPEDNARKANIVVDKYKKMAARHPGLFKKPLFRWLMRRDWGKKLLFIFFGKKKDKRGWPSWVVRTDEERVQNMVWILEQKGPWIATEKIDGSSTTFTMKRGPLGKKDFYICSRNVVFDTPDKKCFYDTNIYVEMAEKYHAKEVLTKLLTEVYPNAKWVTIQGETYGAGVQRRDYSLKEHDFAAFNLITSETGRVNTIDMIDILKPLGIPCVPIVNSAYSLPDTIEEILNYAEGFSKIDGKEREGIVFRSQDGSQSFKAVSNSFLQKYHG